jgi:hypothetical protein
MAVRPGWVWAGVAILLGVTGPLAAQVATIVPAAELGEPLLLSPATTRNAPLFAPAGASVAVTPGGVVGIDPVTLGWGSLTGGLSYLRPVWTSRDFTLAVPSASAPLFRILGDSGHVDSDFAYAPRLTYHYHLANSALGVRATGEFLHLEGNLTRSLTSTAGIGELTATSKLTIASAGLPEFTRRLDLPELFGKDPEDCPFLEQLQVDVGMGTRLAMISQAYNSKLVSSAGVTNTAIRSSTQSFGGFGATGSVDLAYPLGEDLVLFGTTRASLLVGKNEKESTLSVTLAGRPDSASDTILQHRTECVPVLEAEWGVEWGQELASRLRDPTAGQLLTVRVAFVGQFWGDVGPLSAGSARQFRDSDLFLVGATVLVGLHR